MDFGRLPEGAVSNITYWLTGRNLVNFINASKIILRKCSNITLADLNYAAYPRLLLLRAKKIYIDYDLLPLLSQYHAEQVESLYITSSVTSRNLRPFNVHPLEFPKLHTLSCVLEFQKDSRHLHVLSNVSTLTWV